ncbi:conserved hypothetical protein [Sinorhizobium medicae]|uniref:Uncharacterized protein n=1 Tax=Sinorhizobium medicae TaxID=110321 RepID=A0A508WV90_9HYPH|nr:conserved hypothetical protein [Sinorhizobium medicae]
MDNVMQGLPQSRLKGSWRKRSGEKKVPLWNISNFPGVMEQANFQGRHCNNEIYDRGRADDR